MRQQKGFVLISVLTITLITTLLAFSQINENILQERIAGNQQKESNARLAAEKGIFKAFEHIKLRNEAGADNAAILAELENGVTIETGAHYSYPTIILSGDIFNLVSKGEIYGAKAYLKSQIDANENTGDSIFTEAVAGCEGVTVANGIVNSYDSRIADYDANDFNENGSVSTINTGADIELTGSGGIYGNLVSNGNISTGTSSGSSVAGVMTAQGNIQLKGITSSGNIHAGGNLDITKIDATVVDQEINVVGDITGKNNNVTGSVIYGGENSSDVSQAMYSASVQPPDTDMGDCDPLNIVTEMVDINNQITTSGTPTNVFGDFVDKSVAALQVNFTESGATTSNGGSISQSPLDILGESKNVYILDEFDSKNKTVIIDGDITLVIKGDIHLENTTFEFPAGDTTSSLTIITDGQVDLDSLTDLFQGAQLNADKEAPLTIYSAYESDDNDLSDLAVNVTSNGQMYARLYAPEGNVSLGGNGEIMGSIRGKNVDIPAGAGVHYDESLQDLNDIEEQNPTVASYASIYYFYPTE